MADKNISSVASPRKKLATPVKVHLMQQHKISGDGSEEKRDDGQEEKTTVQSSSGGNSATAASGPASKSKRTPVKQALQSAVGLANQGRFLDAVQELDRAMELHVELKANVRLHMNRGTYHFRAGLYEESLADFDRAAKLDDGLASLHFNRANVLKILNRYEEALKSYQRATEIDPKLADAHAGVAHMLMRQKKFRQALASASRALEVSPMHFSALDAKMKSLARLGRTLEAVDSVKALIKCYEQLAKVPPGTLKAVPEEHRKAFSRILCHAAVKIPPSDPSGLELAREAFSLDPCYDACFELANQLFSRGMHEEAATAFKRSGELEPSRSEPPLLESVSWIQLGKFEKALTPLRRASKLQDNQKEVRFYTGLALLNLGRFSEAIPPLRRVLESDSVGSDDEIIEKGRFLLASAYVHAGEEERAFELLQVARRAQRGSRDPEVHFQAGYAASLLGRDTDAQDCFQQCLDIDPDHQRARDAIRNIAEKQKALKEHRPPSPPPLPPPPLSLVVATDGKSTGPCPPRGPPPTPPPAEVKLEQQHQAPTQSTTATIGRSINETKSGSAAMTGMVKPLDLKATPTGLPSVSSPTAVVSPHAVTPVTADVSSPRVASLKLGTAQQPASPRGAGLPGKPIEVTKRSYQKLSHLGVVSGAAAARQAKSGIGISTKLPKPSPSAASSAAEGVAAAAQEGQATSVSSKSSEKVALVETVRGLNTVASKGTTTTTRLDQTDTVPVPPPVPLATSSSLSSTSLKQSVASPPNNVTSVVASAPSVPAMPQRRPAVLARPSPKVSAVAAEANKPAAAQVTTKSTSSVDEYEAGGVPVKTSAGQEPASAIVVQQQPSTIKSISGTKPDSMSLQKSEETKAFAESSSSMAAKATDREPAAVSQVGATTTSEEEPPLSHTKASAQQQPPPLVATKEEEHSTTSKVSAQQQPPLVATKEEASAVEERLTMSQSTGEKTAVHLKSSSSSAAASPSIPSKRPIVPARPASLRTMRPKSESAHVMGSQGGGVDDAPPPTTVRGLKVKSNSADLPPSTSSSNPSLVLSPKLSADVQLMIRKLFGPPEGAETDVELVARVFADEGIERMADVEILTLQDLEALPNLKRAWCRRILNYATRHRTAHDATSPRLAPSLGPPSLVVPSLVVPSLVAPSSAGRASESVTEKPAPVASLMKGLEGFDVKALKKVGNRTEDVDHGVRVKPPGNPMDEMMNTIKNFPRSNLRAVDLSAKKSTAQVSGDASGFLSTLVNAMRSRRVLLDDFDFEGSRKAAASDVDNDDMYEADWT